MSRLAGTLFFGSLLLGTCLTVSTLPLDGLLDWCFHVFYQIAKLFTHIPHADYHVASPSGLSIVVFYVAIVLTLWRWREPTASLQAYVRASAAGIVLVTLTLWV
ncbi:MAG TPA: hypothetical protein EYN18_06990 [Nitrospirales bacterium]|nr:hypothetical protein [Nitrospirales bacterium]